MPTITEGISLLHEAYEQGVRDGRHIGREEGINEGREEGVRAFFDALDIALAHHTRMKGIRIWAAAARALWEEHKP